VRGWVIDCYVDGNRAVSWLRTPQGSVKKVEESFYPDFYVLPRKGLDVDGFAWVLGEDSRVVSSVVEEKYLDLRMTKRVRVIHVCVESIGAFQEIVRVLKECSAVGGLYGTDIMHVQRYLFSRNFAPTMFVEYRNHRFTCVEDFEELAPPPLTTIFVRVEVDGKKVLVDPERDSIKRIILYGVDGEVVELSGSEKHVLEDFQGEVRRWDPDIIVASNYPFRSLDYVVRRGKFLGLNMDLSRDGCGSGAKFGSPVWSSWRGRVCVSLESFEKLGLAGLSELCRFGLIPLGLASRWAPGRIVDSRQVYEAMKLGVLIPEAKGYSDFFRTLEEVFLRDRGGLIISPRVGVHENVCALDFESMYPNLILRRNISYENCDGGSCFGKGLLPRVVEIALGRRLYFKHLCKSFPEGSLEFVYADQRQRALKMMLVVVYGYSGCTWNRFQCVPTFESINLHGREVLIKAINICMREGYQVIYADTDCIFVKKSEASERDFERLAKQISGEVNFPIAIDNLFRFLVLLPSKSDPLVGVMKRYYGKLYDGRLHYRGIELRRHDTPEFIRRFQECLMEILFDARSVEEVMRNYRKAVDFASKIYRRVLSGKVDVNELVVEKVLRKPVGEYLRVYPHVAAGKQLEVCGDVFKGENLVKYVYVNHGSSNPLTRVQVLNLYDGRGYDRKKYGELVLNAAETLLSVFGCFATLL